MKKKTIVNALILLFSTLFGIAAEVGSIAPSISLPDANGKMWNSSEFINKKNLLIFFYPAAMTGGCTKQACSYKEEYKNWKDINFEVIGISGDKKENLKLFKESEELNFTLLSDYKGTVAKAFGVPTAKGGNIQKFVSGERFTLERGVTTKRWTFMISRTGKILYKKENTQATQDSEQAMKFFSKLKQ